MPKDTLTCRLQGLGMEPRFFVELLFPRSRMNFYLQLTAVLTQDQEEKIVYDVQSVYRFCGCNLKLKMQFSNNVLSIAEKIQVLFHNSWATSW